MRFACLCAAAALALACDPGPSPEPTTGVPATGSAGDSTGSAGTDTADTSADADLVREFVDDLRAHLVAHYQQHGDDIAMSGGNTLEQAQNAVTPVLVAELVDPADDPHGHDLATYRVLRHPDVVFVGSDAMWYGAYARDTGVLVEVYDFN